MADKEERITIHQVLYPCKKCSINCNKNDWKNCDFYQNYISDMTRQEAFERMAKALCRTYGEDCETFRFNGNEKGCKRYLEFRNYIAMAEAALNELLEVHDDKR